MKSTGLFNKPCGQSHYRAVLTEEKVRGLRRDYIPFVFSVQKCADKYGCSYTAAKQAIEYETWAHVA